MTWQEAKQLAGERVAGIEQRARDGGAKFISLSDYEDAACFDFLCSAPDNWTFEEYQIVNRAVARKLQMRGWRVVLVPIRLKEFYDWLTETKQDNSPQNRARYTGEVAVKKILDPHN